MFYIYAYLRSDGTPYYIGKGKASRAYYKNKRHRIPIPKDKSLIVIMESNLTEIGALALERRYIRWYGKKIEGGILLNRTDGGEGSSGISLSDETKKKISQSLSGENHPMFGKTHTEDSLSKMRKPRSEEAKMRMKGVKRRPLTPETKLKISLALKSKPKKTYLPT